MDTKKLRELSEVARSAAEKTKTRTPASVWVDMHGDQAAEISDALDAAAIEIDRLRSYVFDPSEAGGK